MMVFSKKYTGFILVIHLLSSLFSCKLAPLNTANTTSSEPALALEPTILLLHYLILKDPVSRSCLLHLVSQTQAPGVLKPEHSESGTPGAGALSCRALDGSGTTLQHILLPNPLITTLEYVDDFGQLAIKTVELDSAHFLLRFQLDSRMKTIALDQINAPGIANTRLLATKIDAL